MQAAAHPGAGRHGYWRPAASAALVAALLALISLIDSATGLFHLTVLYAVPIVLATAAFGLTGGLVTVALAILAVGVTHSLLHSPTLAADLATDVVVFLFAAVVISRLRTQLRTIRRLEARRNLDLGLARDIQRRMLGSPPKDPRYGIACTLDFATEVGGDYYRFEEAEERLFLFAGDISGKGISAALFAVLLDEAIAEALDGSSRLERIVEVVNRRMYVRMPPEMFVTMLFAVLDEDGLSFVNAGHVRPLLLRTGGFTAEELADGGTLPLGIAPSLPAEAASMPLSSGDTLLVCSDGVTESPALLRDEDLLRETFEDAADRGPEAVVEAVTELAESRGQTDDVTVISIRRS